MNDYLRIGICRASLPAKLCTGSPRTSFNNLILVFLNYLKFSSTATARPPD
jgi:hypothetical protein